MQTNQTHNRYTYQHKLGQTIQLRIRKGANRKAAAKVVCWVGKRCYGISRATAANQLRVARNSGAKIIAWFN